MSIFRRTPSSQMFKHFKKLYVLFFGSVGFVTDVVGDKSDDDETDKDDETDDDVGETVDDDDETDDDVLLFNKSTTLRVSTKQLHII
jgi:hypothetical protein